MNITPDYNYQIIARILKESLTEPSLFEQIVTRFTLIKLIQSQDSGIISNLLVYFISKNSSNSIELIELESLNLLKRDKLRLSKYYYHINFARSVTYIQLIDIFNSNDIDYLIENQLFLLLETLVNTFHIAQCTLDIDILDKLNLRLVNPQTLNLKLQFISQQGLTFASEFINDIIGKHSQKQLNTLEIIGSKLKSHIRVIVDGGNIIHLYKGIVNTTSLKNLFLILDYVNTYIGAPLLIIHLSHTKTFPTLIPQLIAKSYNYYLTPPKINDDYYILWFFFFWKTIPFIVSNDHYRDHIFKLGVFPNKVSYELSNILAQQIINIDPNTLLVNFVPSYSKTIQFNATINKFYIPHKTNNFIEINK